MSIPPAPAQPPVQKQGNGFGVTALVLGIIALVLAFIPILNFVSFVLGPLAIIFGIVGAVKSKTRNAGKGTSITGIITGVLALILAITMYVLLFAAADEIVDQACQDMGFDTKEECEQYLDDFESELDNQ